MTIESESSQEPKSDERVKPRWPADGVFRWIGEQMQTSNGRKALAQGCLRLVRKTLRWTTVCYVMLLILQAGMMRWIGEKNVFFAYCLYLPPLVWFLPLLALLPACVLVLEWKGILIGLTGAAATLIGFWGYRVEPPTPIGLSTTRAEKRQLVVLTNNRGQRGDQSMRPFKDAVSPDIMVFQEAGGVSARYLADPHYSEFKEGKDVGEFSLISKFPILSAEPITFTVRSKEGAKSTVPSESFMVAARYEIDFFGSDVVVYNIHLPTPRGTLQYYMRGAFVYGVIGVPGTRFGEKRIALQVGWDQRIELVRQLIDRAGTESKPTILAGDFNMPNVGFCYSLVSGRFQDSHALAGSGFGFTFPGTTRNPVALGGPWMRIDYVFTDKEHWRIDSSVVEEHRPSQHRAGATLVTLNPPSQHQRK